MNTVLILKEKDNLWVPEDWFTSQGGICLENGQITLEVDDSWVSIIRANEVISDFDGHEKSLIFDELDEPEIYLIEWRGNELLQSFINSLPTNVKILVDNDHGLICDVCFIKNYPVSEWLEKAELKKINQ